MVSAPKVVTCCALFGAPKGDDANNVGYKKLFGQLNIKHAKIKTIGFNLFLGDNNAVCDF